MSWKVLVRPKVVDAGTLDSLKLATLACGINMKPLKNLLILPVEMDELYTITRGVTTQKSKSATLLIRKLRKPTSNGKV